MITYELAKRLKDAGFPQELGNNHLFHQLDENSPRITIPSLSQLIEACGDNFGCISKANSSESKIAWGNNEWHASFETIMGYIHGYGSSPEEAVARLWLELNKK